VAISLSFFALYAILEISYFLTAILATLARIVTLFCVIGYSTCEHRNVLGGLDEAATTWKLRDNSHPK